MKRMFMLGLALVMMGGTAFSQDVKPTLKAGGHVTWGFTANPDESQYDDVLDWADIYFTGNTDEYNTFKILMEYYGDAPEGGDNPVLLDEAYMTTDVAKYLGLSDFGVIFNWRNGYDDSNGAIYSAGTRYGFDEVTDSEEVTIDDAWISEVTVGFAEMVTVKTAWGWDNAQGEDDIPDLLVEASTAISGIHVAANYTTNRTSGGAVGVTSKIVLAEFVPGLADAGMSVDLGGSFVRNLAEADDYTASEETVGSVEPEQAVWGASARFGIAGADLGVSYKGGVEDDTNGAYGFAILGFDAGYQVSRDIGVYGGVAFDFTDYEAVDVAAENIDGLAGGEVGASLDIGASNFKTGYWFSDGYGAGAINALGANQDGGVFFRFTHSWGGV